MENRDYIREIESMRLLWEVVGKPRRLTRMCLDDHLDAMTGRVQRIQGPDAAEIARDFCKVMGMLSNDQLFTLYCIIQGVGSEDGFFQHSGVIGGLGLNVVRQVVADPMSWERDYGELNGATRESCVDGFGSDVQTLFMVDARLRGGIEHPLIDVVWSYQNGGRGSDVEYLESAYPDLEEKYKRIHLASGRFRLRPPVE